MSDQANSYQNVRMYIPASLSEIYDLIGAMMLEAPTFIDRSEVFRHRSLDSRFYQLTESFAVTRAKLGEERYAALIDLAARAKALFAADQDDANGKTDQGREVLLQIEDLVQSARRRRVKSKLPDDEGRVTGD